MNKFITASLLKLIGMLMNDDLLLAIKNLVTAEFFSDKTGAGKKASVDSRLRELRGELGKVVAETSDYLINLAIEGVVAYLKARR